MKITSCILNELEIFIVQLNGKCGVIICCKESPVVHHGIAPTPSDAYNAFSPIQNF